MSSFGAVPIDGAADPVHRADRVGQQGPGRRAGAGLRDRRTAHLLAHARATRPASASICSTNGAGFEANGQWRFTPPVQVVAALSAPRWTSSQAEGGIAARHARYAAQLRRAGARHAGAGLRRPTSTPELQAPVIVTFRIPAGGWFEFEALLRLPARARHRHLSRQADARAELPHRLHRRHRPRRHQPGPGARSTLSSPSSIGHAELSLPPELEPARAPGRHGTAAPPRAARSSAGPASSSEPGRMRACTSTGPSAASACAKAASNPATLSQTKRAR